MKKLRLLSCIVTIALGVSFAVPSFALEAAYWLCGTTDWGDFGVAENWAIGSSESEVSLTPCILQKSDMETYSGCFVIFPQK